MILGKIKHLNITFFFDCPMVELKEMYKKYSSPVLDIFPFNQFEVSY